MVHHIILAYSTCSVAVAGIRGGGEYGPKWHEAALGIKRWVGWDDFAWAAKYLQGKGLTIPALTATYGTSNGGLLVSAAMVRNPSLYSVVFPDVAITDLLRYHKFVCLFTSLSNRDKSLLYF